jgi:hypothetical protein
MAINVKVTGELKICQKGTIQTCALRSTSPTTTTMHALMQ